MRKHAGHHIETFRWPGPCEQVCFNGIHLNAKLVRQLTCFPQAFGRNIDRRNLQSERCKINSIAAFAAGGHQRCRISGLFEVGRPRPEKATGPGAIGIAVCRKSLIPEFLRNALRQA